MKANMKYIVIVNKLIQTATMHIKKNHEFNNEQYTFTL